MLDNKELNQAEELSQCLDHCNDGSHPIAEDEEIKELVAIAHLVKQSYHQEVIPHVLIGELVDHLAVELTALKIQKRRTHWLYGGLMGTAAAVLIAAFIQFIVPPTADHHIAQKIDESTETQKKVAVAEQASGPSVSQPTEALIGQQTQSGSSREISNDQSVEKKGTDKISKVIIDIIQVAEAPKVAQKPTQVAMLQPEKPQDIAREKSGLMAKRDVSSLGTDKKRQLEPKFAIIVLPNQTTQSITVDHASGVIRQVYNQGTTDEITMTQRLLDENITNTKRDIKQGEAQKHAESAALQTIHKDTQEVMNSLTIKFDQYYITLEGKKTKEDLQKLAETITGMK